MSRATIPVIAAPMIDPGCGRIDLQLPEGLRLSEIVSTALPGATAVQLRRCRVALVTTEGEEIIEARFWSRVRPRPGVHVVIRVMPGKDVLRPILQVVVSIAAIALGQVWAPALAGAFGISTQLAAAAISIGVTAIGNLLINALIPPSRPDTEGARPVFMISGWKNRANPDGAVPVVVGEHRVAPVFAAPSYTEIVGDLQYVRALFCFGYGPLSLSDFKIGETSLDEYDEVEIEVREGLPGDEPVTLYPRQVIEDQHGSQLLRQRPRDDFGEPTDEPIEDQPVTRFTAADAAEATVIVGFPAGLFRIDDDGDQNSYAVDIRIRQRPAGSESAWQDVITLKINANKREAFYRTHRWAFEERGRYEVDLTRMSNEANSTQISDRCVWFSLQSIRPEYPIAFDKPLAIAAIRVKATYQLNNALDNFNAMARLRCLDWDAATGEWTLRETRNPASLFRYVLQSPANAFPAGDAEINLDDLADWHAFCAAKGLKYGRIHQERLSLQETLTMVAAAGRASPRHDGRQWSVVIDRPTDRVIDHVNPRNSRDFRWSRQYLKLPDALRVSFLDQTNDYQAGERIVPWPGHEGEVLVTEQLELPGKTDPDEIWREARRRQYEIMHRPDRYTAIQDGAARVATRGDLVMGSFDILSRFQKAARVVSIRDRLIEFDDVVTMEAGSDYAVRFQVFEENDTVGESFVRPALTVAGESRTVVLKADGQLPRVGSLVHFGTLASESFPLIVSGVEPGEDFSGVLTMIDAAPIIDELTDAEVPPAWDGRVGEILAPSGLIPATPRITEIASGMAGTNTPNGLSVLLTPGSGGAVVAEYELDIRQVGEIDWNTLAATAASGGFEVDLYAKGDLVELRARALSAEGVPSPYTPTATVEIGGNDAPVPEALPQETITANAGVAHAEIAFATGDDASTVSVQLYRDGEAKGDPLPVSTLSSHIAIDGDATRSNLVSPLTAEGDWAAAGGWTVDGGEAQHTAGTADPLTHAVALEDGKTYRVAFTVSGRSAGTVTAGLEGPSTLVEGGPVTGNARHSVDLVANGSEAVRFLADATFDGTVSNVKVYRPTAASIPPGTYSYQLEPLNADGSAGPRSDAVEVII